MKSFKAFITEGYWYHGSNQDIKQFNTPIVWLSKTKDLAVQYAKTSVAVRDGEPTIMKFLFSPKKSFKFGYTNNMTIDDFVDSIMKQSTMDIDISKQIKKLKVQFDSDTLDKNVFWDTAGNEIKELLLSLGFDSIRVEENGHETIGIITPEKLRKEKVENI